MIFQHTLEQVLDGTKTQTSRIVKPGDLEAGYRWGSDNGKSLDCAILCVSRNDRQLWHLDSTYAVQPGYGKKAVARIRILRICQMDVREFTPDDIVAEGFVWKRSFFQTWCEMIDHSPPSTLDELYTRSGERYQAWVLGFELVKS